MKLIVSIAFILFLPSMASGQIPNKDSLMTSLRQTTANNCVSIALIQAAIAVWGIDKVFDARKNEDGSFFIRLKNKDTLSITQEELRIATCTGKIGYDTSFKYVYDYAVLCYAVIIKHRMKLDTISKFTDAAKEVAGGGSTPVSFYYLGLEQYAVCKPHFARVDDLTGVVAWRYSHAVYASSGKYFSRRVKKLSFLFYGRYVLNKSPVNDPACRQY